MRQSMKEAVRTLFSRSWTTESVIARLRRDAEVTAAFLEGVDPPPAGGGRRSAQAQGAVEYQQWCRDTAAALDAVDGADLASSIDEWRLRAVAADVRTTSIGVEARLLSAVLCGLFGAVQAVAHSWPIAAVLLFIAAALAVSTYYSRSVLAIGPDASHKLSPFLTGESPLGRRGQGLAFRLANKRRI